MAVVTKPLRILFITCRNIVALVITKKFTRHINLKKTSFKRCFDQKYQKIIFRPFLVKIGHTKRKYSQELHLIIQCKTFPNIILHSQYKFKGFFVWLIFFILFVKEYCGINIGVMYFKWNSHSKLYCA